MSRLLKKVLWYGDGGSGNGIELTDVQRISIRRAMDPKSNGTEILLTNPKSVNVNNVLYHKYIDSGTGDIKFKEGDVIKVYAKHSDDATEISTSPDSTDLFMSAEVQEVNPSGSERKTTINLKCIDKTYIALSKLWSFVYLKEDVNAPNTEGWTSPLIIQNLIRWTTGDSRSFERYDYYGNLVINGLFDIDARLDTDPSNGGGKIETKRPSGKGTADSDTDLFPAGDVTQFPFVELSNVFKSVYEWVDELSSVEMTNTFTENDNNTPVCNRKMMFYVDERNRFHWFYPTTTTNLTIQSDDFSDNDIVIDWNMTKATFDIINMVVYNAGTDMNDVGILDYYFDKNTNSPKLKMVFKAWTGITRDMKASELATGKRLGLTTIVRVQGDEYNYPTAYTDYDGTEGLPTWDPTTSIASDTAFNNNFRKFAIVKGDNKSSILTAKHGSARWKGNVTVKLRNISVGDLINLTIRPAGIKAQKVRVISVTHNIGTKIGTTTLTVEEDEKEKGV